MLQPSVSKLVAHSLPGIAPAAPRSKEKRGRSIPPNLRELRRVKRRALLDARHEACAIEHVLELPADGESLHLVIDGRFDPCDIIPATRRLSGAASIADLTITTLSFNRHNVDTLCSGLDQGKIGHVLLMPSVYFSQVEKPLFAHTRQELESRGSRAEAGYVHCKLILMEMSDGRCFTVEGSGNLRSCKSIEQLVMSCDRPLLEFHRAWIASYLQERTTYGRREGRRRASGPGQSGPDVDPGGGVGVDDPGGRGGDLAGSGDGAAAAGRL